MEELAIRLSEAGRGGGGGGLVKGLGLLFFFFFGGGGGVNFRGVKRFGFVVVGRAGGG